MSRKRKVSAEEKMRIVEKYLGGKVSSTEACRMACVDAKNIKKWVDQYETEGLTGLLQKEHNLVYGKETKLSAVLDYQAGKGTLRDICKQYGIRDARQLRNWLKVYNRHEDSRILTGGNRMTKSKSTTIAERIQIVRECLDSGNNYGEIALKYQASYWQVYVWAKKYRDMGKSGLEDRRGHRAGTLRSRTPEEELKDRIASLEREKNNLKMENALLKKYRNWRRGDAEFRKTPISI